jgi:hypothetical protein
MGRVCGIYRRQERCIQGFLWGNLIERDHLDDPNVNGSIILKLTFKKWDGEAWTILI